MTYKKPCPKCGSKDNLVVFDDGGEYCFTPGCGVKVLSEEYRKPEIYEEEEDIPMFQEQWNTIKSKTIASGRGYRGIRDDIYAKFGVRHEYQKVLMNGEEKEELIAQYYPLTRKGESAVEICGTKIRYVPKRFMARGINKQSETHLFGQANFINSLSKTVVITSGECFPPDVEVMTEHGFKRFDELTKNERVLQVHEDMTTSLVRPLAYIEKDYEGELIEVNSRKYRTICTPNHNVVYFDGKGRIVKKEAKEKVRWSSPIVVQHEGEGIPLTNDQIALLLAVCADSKLDSRANSNQRAHFSLMKQRKIQRLKGILERLGIAYTSYTKTWSVGKTYTTFNFTLPDWIESKTIPFDWVLSATQVQREFILSELLHWDGNYSKKGWYEFTSKHLSECDTIYQLLILSGRYGHVRERSNKYGTWYVTSWQDEGKPQDGQTRKKSRIDYKGKVYCVTVPSGMILTRYAGRTAVIGNCDTLATYQMLLDNLRDHAPAVVSSTCGEGAVGQYRAQYEFLNKFDRVILIPDSDKAGREAMKKAVQALPKDKVYIIHIPEIYKDPNGMLLAGKEDDFTTLYFRAKPYVPDGVVGSSELYHNLLESTLLPKIPLPPFLHELQDMLAGGFVLESIVNIAAASGLGKSTFVNELVLYWIFHSPYKVGVVSMELSAGQYANALFSRYVGKKLSLMDTPALSAYLNSDEAKEKANELFKLDNGSDRFFLIEDRSSKLQIIQDLIIQLIIGCGCKMIIIDPIQDLIGSLSLEQQENHMSWQKVLVKAYNVCIVNVSHTRKAGDTKSSGSLGAIPSEEAMSGSSSIIKSGSVNILLARNKMAEDELERNTIKVFLSKSRQTGITGPAGHIYYDVPTHTLHDESAYRAMYPEKFSPPDEGSTHLEHSSFVEGSTEEEGTR